MPAYQPPCGMLRRPACNWTRTGLRIDPITGRQYVIPHGPIDDIGPAYFWTGSVLLAVNTSGSMGGAHAIDAGSAAYWTPATDRWTSLPRAPMAGYGAAVVWTGPQPADLGAAVAVRASVRQNRLVAGSN